MVPFLVPTVAPADMDILLTVPPPPAKAKAVQPWSVIPPVVQSIMYSFGLFAVAVYANVVFCAPAL